MALNAQFRSSSRSETAAAERVRPTLFSNPGHAFPSPALYQPLHFCDHLANGISSDPAKNQTCKRTVDFGRIHGLAAFVVQPPD